MAGSSIESLPRGRWTVASGFGGLNEEAEALALVFDQPDAHHGANKVLALETPMPVFGLSPDFLASRPKRSDVQPVMFGGEGAVGAPLEGLKQAQEMQAAGAPAEDIYAKTKTPQTTGWFQGPEEKWRFEFSDKEAQFNPEALAKMHGGQATTLDQLLSHPQLFQYYFQPMPLQH